MVHRNVDADHRTTVVSANSLAAQAGGAASGIVLGVVADATSISAAMIVAGVILLGAAPLYLVRPTRPPAHTHSVEAVRLPESSAVGG